VAKTFSISVDIEAPPEKVWTVMSDVERWHEWTASIRSVTRLGAGPLVVGARARVRQPKLLPADFVVTELDERKGFTWVTSSPGVTATARHLIEPTPRGTPATLSVEFEGIAAPIVAWMTRDLNNRYLALEAAGLKRRAEVG
jgi:uncharacterized protein YndB with AHSA1/START domain